MSLDFLLEVRHTDHPSRERGYLHHLNPGDINFGSLNGLRLPEYSDPQKVLEAVGATPLDLVSRTSSGSLPVLTIESDQGPVIPSVAHLSNKYMRLNEDDRQGLIFDAHRGTHSNNKEVAQQTLFEFNNIARCAVTNNVPSHFKFDPTIDRKNLGVVTIRGQNQAQAFRSVTTKQFADSQTALTILVTSDLYLYQAQQRSNFQLARVKIEYWLHEPDAAPSMPKIGNDDYFHRDTLAKQLTRVPDAPHGYFVVVRRSVDTIQAWGAVSEPHPLGKLVKGKSNIKSTSPIILTRSGEVYSSNGPSVRRWDPGKTFRKLVGMIVYNDACIISNTAKAKYIT